MARNERRVRLHDCSEEPVHADREALLQECQRQRLRGGWDAGESRGGFRILLQRRRSEVNCTLQTRCVRSGADDEDTHASDLVYNMLCGFEQQVRRGALHTLGCRL